MSYSVKGLPFVFKGVTAVGDCETSEDVMRKAKLDFTVGKCELQGKINTGFDYTYPPVEGFYATYRTDTNRPLGVVKSKYTPVQNIDAFNFFDKAIGDGNAEWFTAGNFNGGQTIFVSAKLPDEIRVNGEDVVNNYLIFTNSHDGTSGVKIMVTPVRLICQNMLNMSIRNATSYVSFKHTTNVHSKIDIADEILGITRTKIIAYSEICNYLGKIKMTDEQTDKFIVNFVLSDKERESLKEFGYSYKNIVNRHWSAMEAANISTKKVNTIGDIIRYYRNGVGQQEIIGTAWGTLNAITGYYSNMDNNSGENRMQTLIYGDRANKIKRATELLLAA